MACIFVAKALLLCGTSSGTVPAMNELDRCVMVRRAVYTSKPDITTLSETLFVLILSPIHSTFHSADPKVIHFSNFTNHIKMCDVRF